ncbi:MAG TPA: dienelactone hydrolase family protein [Woeseiaceae bacterium]|jgi:dienelactone hydrolase
MFIVNRYLLIVIALSLGSCGKSQEPSVATSPESSPAAAENADLSGVARIVGEEIRYEAGGTALKGYLAYDAARTGPRPGVLIVHEWWGHNDYVRDRARMLAEMGYTAFALDMYGDGKQATHPEDAQKFSMEIFNNMQVGMDRFTAAHDLLQVHATTDAGKIAAIGYCFGGAVVLHMARSGLDLDAVASFHGSLGTSSPAAPGAVKARVLVAHGAEDPFVPQADVDAFKAEMQAAGADLTFIAYPGAVHSFTRPGATEIGEQFDLPLRYDAAADHASWTELQTFLADSFSD